MRQALHVIRGAIGAEALIEEQRQHGIAPGQLAVDLDALEAALSAGRLDEACSIRGRSAGSPPRRPYLSGLRT